MGTRHAEEKPNPLESLSARIKGTAYNIARRYGGSKADVEQDLIVLLLERYAEDPNFLDDPVAAITYAANRVGWQVRKERYHAARIGIRGSQFTDDPGDDSVAEAYPATTNPWPAVHCRLAISEALEQLNTRDQQIATGLAWEYSVQEIGSMIDCPRRTVYHRMRHTIAQTLSI